VARRFGFRLSVRRREKPTGGENAVGTARQPAERQFPSDRRPRQGCESRCGENWFGGFLGAKDGLQSAAETGRLSAAERQKDVNREQTISPARRSPRSRPYQVYESAARAGSPKRQGCPSGLWDFFRSRMVKFESTKRYPRPGRSAYCSVRIDSASKRSRT
jgi:hypothetical protein